MSAVTENSIRQEQLQSFGRLLAGFSHEMKNHLGIIRESNGLMGDILEMGGLAEDEPTVRRFKKSISSIERRIVTTADMLHHLSGLAHRLDTPLSSFSINELVTEECTFLERFSRLKQIDLSLELGKDIAPVYSDPSLLQHLIYRLYVLCLEHMEAGQTLVILTGRTGEQAVIIFRIVGGRGGLPPEEMSFDRLVAVVGKVCCMLSRGGSEQNEITLTIPSLSVVEQRESRSSPPD